MKYREIKEGRFIDRPNRFIAHVEIGGREETVHVKNTGRCRELLKAGATGASTWVSLPRKSLSNFKQHHNEKAKVLNQAAVLPARTILATALNSPRIDWLGC